MDASQGKKIICGSCGKELNANANFCQYCGAKIEIKVQTCSSCGQPIGPGMLFCPCCGAKVENAFFDNVGMNDFTDSIFIHDSDRKALEALKSIPGFTAFFKAFMKVYSERKWRILNMSSNLRISEEQLPKYYDMLVPVCEKLKIEVPELYMEMNPTPNAWTYGDTKPFITLTSGLIKTLPDDLIQTVIAHECGHIVCHHTLYTTMAGIMAELIASGMGALGGYLGKLASVSILIALFYWKRCSEFSADRAAAVFNGSEEKSVELCMRFAGWDKDIADGARPDLFMKQAEEYKDIVTNSTWDKLLELSVVINKDHPFNAVRAYEIDKWAKTYDFQRALKQYE